MGEMNEKVLNCNLFEVIQTRILNFTMAVTFKT